MRWPFAWRLAAVPMAIVSPMTGFPTQWPIAPKWPWARPMQIQPNWAPVPERRNDFSDSALTGVPDHWGLFASGNSGQPGGIVPPTVGIALNGISDARGTEYYARLSNVIPDRAGRTMTYWAAAESTLHKGMRPMVEFDAPSIQTTIRRGTVLSDPYVAELRARGVIGPGVPASPPAWTMQGYLFYNNQAHWSGNAPRPGQGGLVRTWG